MQWNTDITGAMTIKATKKMVYKLSVCCKTYAGGYFYD